MEIQLNPLTKLHQEHNIRDHFHFVSKKITINELDSFLPYYKCDEIGHEELILDQVCIDDICQHKGLTCPRCVNIKHGNHISKIINLNTFISDLIYSQSEKKSILNKEFDKSKNYKDLLMNISKEFVEDIIEHFSLFISQIYKYFNVFLNEYEDLIIRSDVIIDKILHRQHIRRDLFGKYIKNIIENIGNKEKSEFLLKDYEKAFEKIKDFQENIIHATKQTKDFLKENLSSLTKKMDLKTLGTGINYIDFDMGTLALQRKFKNQYQNKLEGIFQNFENINGNEQNILKENIQNKYQVKQEDLYPSYVDYARKKCILGRTFKTIQNAQILKVNTIKTSQVNISCICVISQDLVAVAGKFSPFIEFYRLSDKQIITKIDTLQHQGIKCMILMRKEQDEIGQWQPILVIGTYSEEDNIISYKIDILKKYEGKESINISVKTYKKFEKLRKAAVSYLAQLYLNQFFIAGFSSGCISIYSVENSIALNNVNNLFDQPIHNIYVVEEGKFFITATLDKIRFHTINLLTHERIEQDISTFYIGSNSMNCILPTNAFNQEGSYLNFQHIICGDFKFEDMEQYKEGCIRILRGGQKSIRMCEEQVVSVLNGGQNNAIKDIVIIEPRVKQRMALLLVFGYQHRIKLFELKSQFGETLKLWEKNVDDFINNVGKHVIKAKLLCESVEVANIKWADVNQKVQILSAFENSFTGKIQIRFAVVNHQSKCDVDIFELEMEVGYS
ncbi:hypothetical protein IMG5_169350 [Ichthyophthirius multifiliis]|uniref:Uncharacterized protein n=1 Tax=Ichthyophthirius multifiliis TaxID=5932 RepID=G0R1A5_ICHMU|nr:hypothetical protein IMG5_169350 [Ichthyophthirius multifiliis]EGR28738.1 hypothetical protein IMG5_169350 [Ichthyophthirius multifiliis]|eukprot:XP_004029974.1 hypothetical protein IMG5_169350 [Ichthyophthirius multifiliis]